MVYWDNIIIEDEVAKSTDTTSGTEYLDLPETGYLSQLNLRAAIVSVWADEVPLNIWQAITKVEVLVNGSQVVKSLDARQIRALAWYHGMDLIPLGTYNRHSLGDDTFWTFPILFGTHVGDKKHMLDLAAYSNPVLRVTWNAAPASFDGVSCDLHTSPNFRYGLDGVIMRGAPEEPIEGYVKSSQIDSWITANGATHTTEIPKGQDLLGLMIGGRHNDVDTTKFFDNIKLDFDNGKWVALNHGFQQLMAFYATWFPKTVETALYTRIQHFDTPDPMVGFIDSASVMDGGGNVGALQLAGPEFPLYDLGLLSVVDGSPLTDANDVNLKWTGRLPHQTMYIPMHAFTGEKWKPIPTTEYGRIDLKTTMATTVGTSATEKVVAEYLMPSGM